MTDTKSPYWQSVQAVETWLIENDYKGYDPFDGLSSYLRVFTFRKRFPQQVLQQFVRRNPFNLRPLLGIRPHTSTKGMGFLAGGYLKLFLLTGEEKYRDKAEWCLQWLMSNNSEGYSGYCWGNAFDYVSRGSDIAKGAPTVVWSGLIGRQFIEAWRVLKSEQYLDIAKSIGTFILKDLPRFPAPNGLCISYVVPDKLAVHNANLIGARMLASLYKETGDKAYYDIATDAVRYSARAQLENGAWYYGEEPKFHWIDNWHTAYNLDSILEYQLETGSTEFQDVLDRGLQFYVDHFFRPNGAPKYYWDRDYKYDIQSSSQSIDTLLLFARHFRRPELVALAEKVARWTIDNMQDPSGYFYLWKNSWFTNKTPTLHWGAATMFHALSHLMLEIHVREP
jgi:rhamnogalacturonyl hydrolase YesR